MKSVEGFANLDPALEKIIPLRHQLEALLEKLGSSISRFDRVFLFVSHRGINDAIWEAVSYTHLTLPTKA